MANQLNSGALDTLKTGQTLLTKVYKTKKAGMVQIEIAERIDNPNATSSLGEGFTTFYSFANGSTGKPRRFWDPIEAIYLETMLQIPNLDIENGEYATDVETGKEYMELNILNPTAYVNPQTGEAVELRMRGRVIETTEGKEYDINNQRYKVNPSTKEPVLHGGNYIYNKNQILFVENTSDELVLPHVFLASDTVSVTSKVESEETVVEEMNML
tara:strand:- start:39 stop:680 length:642 start_codon:yes stop_codon:yes gene_type:complete